MHLADARRRSSSRLSRSPPTPERNRLRAAAALIPIIESGLNDGKPHEDRARQIVSAPACPFEPPDSGGSIRLIDQTHWRPKRSIRASNTGNRSPITSTAVRCRSSTSGSKTVSGPSRWTGITGYIGKLRRGKRATSYLKQ